MRIEQGNINIPLHQVFLQIVTDFGEDVVTDNRLIALLSDLGGSEFNQYKFIVRCSIDKGIGTQILEMKNLDEADRMLKIGNLKQSLIDEYSLQVDKVNYIFDCYLYALGIINDIEQIDNSTVKNTESNTEEETAIPFKPDSFIFDELLTLFRKHSTIARGNGRVSKRKEISNLKVNILTFTQAVETKYNVQLNLPSLSSFLMVEDFLDYIINTCKLKSVENNTLQIIDNTSVSQQIDEASKVKNRGSYIKIDDPSLTNLPIFAEILNIIRAIACFDINEYTGTCDYCWYNWYENLPEKIQLHYGVRPELPPKERFEYVGDLIKYIVQKYEIREKKKLEPLPLWGKIIYVFPAPILISILGKLWLEGKAKYDQIMLGLENTKWHEWGKKGDIKDAAASEVAWVYILALVFWVGVSLYYKYFLKDEIDFENSIAGYLVKFSLMMLLVSVLMQWWPCLVVAILEIVIRYYKLNKTGGYCIRTFMNKR